MKPSTIIAMITLTVLFVQLEKYFAHLEKFPTIVITVPEFLHRHVFEILDWEVGQWIQRYHYWHHHKPSDKKLRAALTECGSAHQLLTNHHERSYTLKQGLQQWDIRPEIATSMHVYSSPTFTYKQIFKGIKTKNIRFVLNEAFLVKMESFKAQYHEFIELAPSWEAMRDYIASLHTTYMDLHQSDAIFKFENGSATKRDRPPHSNLSQVRPSKKKRKQ